MTEEEFHCFLGEALRATIKWDIFTIDELGVIAFTLYAMGDDGLMFIRRSDEKINRVIKKAIDYDIFENIIEKDECYLTLGEKLKWLLKKYKLDKNSEQEKEYIPLTPYNIDDFALTPEEIIEYGRKFNRFLGKFHGLMSHANINSKTLDIFSRMTEFVFSNGKIEFFTYKIKYDEKEVIKAIKGLEKKKFIEVIKIEKIGYDTFIKLQLIGDLRAAYDEAFKE